MARAAARVIDKPAARYLAMAAALRGYAVIVPEAKEVTDGDQNGDHEFDGMSRLLWI